MNATKLDEIVAAADMEEAIETGDLAGAIALGHEHRIEIGWVWSPQDDGWLPTDPQWSPGKRAGR